jgi:hypothetical protein
MKDLVHVPSGTRTLADLIAFNTIYSELELPPGYEDQNRYCVSVRLNSRTLMTVNRQVRQSKFTTSVQ